LNRAFQKKLEIFKHNFQTELNHFPRLLKQSKGKKDTIYVQFVEKLAINFAYDLTTFLFESSCCGFLETLFFVTDIIELSLIEMGGRRRVVNAPHSEA